MSFVVEAIFGAPIDWMINKLMSSELLDIFREGKLLRSRNKWVKHLGVLRAILTDAEKKQVTNEAVKIWLGQIRDLALDAEDILDEFQYEVLRKYMEESRASASNSRSLIPAWCGSLAPRNLAFRSNMKSKFEDITTRFEQLLKEKGDLAPDVDVSEPPNKKQKRVPTTSLVDEVFQNIRSLRTFLPLPTVCGFFGYEAYISINVLRDLISQLKFLRVLSLSGYQISELPESVDGLKHLRYMNLSHTPIKNLPESLCSLYYLQTLILKDCTYLRQLPTSIHELTNLRHLDIRGTTKLRELSKGLRHLKHLRTLSKFTVGKSGNLCLDELGCLNHIGGEISILDLRNVVHIREASAAKLKEKKRLSRLELHWCQDLVDDFSDDDFEEYSGNDDFEDVSRDSVNEFHVLKSLRPHTGSLKKLVILFYGGVSFPSWVGDPSFSGLVDLRLEKCKKCKQLPCLGQLPSLKNLTICEMDEVERVGWEFYSSHADASSSSQLSPFPSLEYLRFEKMTKWVDWSLPDTSFAKLLHLVILECPLLVFPLSRLNSTASHLQRLKLRGCSDAIIRDSNIELASLKYLCFGSISGLSSLPELLLRNVEELRIESCLDLERMSNGLHMLASLNELHIFYCPKLEYLELPLMLRILSVRHCKALTCVAEGSNSTCSSALSGLSLQSLHILIEECQLLTSISGNQWFRNIETLKIRSCKSLESFPSRQLPTTLKSLEIRYCHKLESVSEMLIESTSLKDLSFCYCPKLKSLPECLHTLTDLTSLEVMSCAGIETFPDTGLPTPNLLALTIKCCPNLKSLPNNMHNLTSLRDLRISNCPLLGLRLPPNLRHFTIDEPREALITFPNDQFLVLPHSLNSLTIWNFPNLESISSPGLLNLTSLQELGIHSCPKLHNMSENGFQYLTSLRRLRISDCRELQHLPETGFQNLISLENLEIEGCPKLHNMSENGFQYLTSLRRLRISDCRELQHLPETGFQNLISLENLEIKDCPKLQHLPNTAFVNLTSLKQLTITRCQELQHLPETGLMNLTSLEVLSIKCCPELQRLPETGLLNLTSLEVLEIADCAKLQRLPEKGLPPTLLSLEISECPLLDLKGAYWPHVALIPHVVIDDDLINC
ncbi:Rx, N-terminal [Dillenia turbinata]|uniref:Rx, N-terminal n=1 Tax=Dillenia turbinata TaxID=194707 RepID=A0AAN8V5I5_9MAGN